MNRTEILTQLSERLKELDAEREETLAAIRVLQRLGTRETVDSGSRGGMYAEMTHGAAAIAFLRSVGKPQTTRQVTNALESGGIQHESKNFFNTIYNVLRREAKGGGVVSVGKKWTVPEHSRAVPMPLPRNLRSTQDDDA